MGEKATDERQRLEIIVRRLIEGDYESDDALEFDMAQFAASVPHTRASDLIYFWDREFDREPSARDIVDRALAYRPRVL